VAVSFEGDRLERGLLCPFHLLKKEIDKLCGCWDERVLIPSGSEWVETQIKGNQCEVHLKTPMVSKFYSFPDEDVVLLTCDNLSCENLARLFSDQLALRLRDLNLVELRFEVSVAESAGQQVTYIRD